LRLRNCRARDGVETIGHAGDNHVALADETQQRLEADVDLVLLDEPALGPQDARKSGSMREKVTDNQNREGAP
jgi:hypothetical protein